MRKNESRQDMYLVSLFRTSAFNLAIIKLISFQLRLKQMKLIYKGKKHE